MSENEKRLRGWCQNAPSMLQALEALLDETRADARAAALEEVCGGLAEQAEAARSAGEMAEVADVLDSTHDWVHALASSPAPAAIPVRGEDELFAAIDAEVREYRGSTAPVRDAIRRALGNAASEAILAAAAEHLARNRGLDVGGTATFLQGRVDGTVPATIPVAKVRAVLDKASATLERQGYGAGIVRDIARELGLTREEEMKPVGCCDLYGTPHQECRTAPEREPPIGPPRVRCGGCDGVLDDGACLECCR